MFWANAYCLWVFFCAINPAKSVRRYNSNMHLHYSAVNSWLTNATFSQSEIIYAKSKRSAFWASPTRDDQNAKDMGMGMPISLWHRISFLPTSCKNPLAVASRKLFVSPFHRVSHLMRPRFSFPSFPPFPVPSTSNSLTRGSISLSLIQRAWKGLSRIVCYLHYYICTRGRGGGYSGFKLTGMMGWSNEGKNQNPKKSLGPNKTKKKSLY